MSVDDTCTELASRYSKEEKLDSIMDKRQIHAKFKWINKIKF